MPMNPDQKLLEDTEWEQLPLNEEDEWEKVTPASEMAESEAPSLLNKAGRKGLEYFGKASRAVDSVTGAPIRAGVSAGIKGESPVAAYKQQFLEDPAKAPTGKDIAMQVGLSGEPTIESPLTLNPWDPEANKLSPAGIAGAGVEVATDPLTYAGIPVGKAAQLGAKGASKLTPKVGKYLEGIAQERAMKAATGQNLAAIRRAAKIKAGEAPPISKVKENIRKSGAELLKKDAEGEPIIGWFSSAEDVGERAAGRTAELKKQFEAIGKKIDETHPDGIISGKQIANDMLEYAQQLPNTERGKALQERILKDAENIQAEGPMTFAQAQKFKNDFKFKADAADALESNQDAINEINQIIGRRMDEAAEKTNLGTEYSAAKKQYGPMLDVQKATSERYVKDLSNRFVSPSDYAVGATGALSSASPDQAIKNAATAALTNKVIRERGNAFVARSLNAVAEKLKSSPESLGKFGKVLNAAAIKGNANLALIHKLLLNNNPEYVQLLQHLENKKEE